MSRKTVIKFLILFLVFGIVSFFVERLFHINLDSLKRLVLSFGPFAPVFYTLMLFLGLSVPLNPISDFLVVSLAAAIFPPEVAILATFCAQFLALTVNYWVARRFEHTILRKITSADETESIEKLSKKIRLSWIFALRFILPLTAIGIDLVSYAAGTARLNYKKFMIVSLIPWTLYNTIFFFSTDLAKQISSKLFFVPAIIIIAVSVAIFIWFRNHQTHKKMFEDFKLKD